MAGVAADAVEGIRRREFQALPWLMWARSPTEDNRRPGPRWGPKNWVGLSHRALNSLPGAYLAVRWCDRSRCFISELSEVITNAQVNSRCCVELKLRDPAYLRTWARQGGSDLGSHVFRVAECRLDQLLRAQPILHHPFGGRFEKIVDRLAIREPRRLHLAVCSDAHFTRPTRTQPTLVHASPLPQPLLT